MQKLFSITAVFLFLLMSQVTLAQTATAPGGSGTQGDPYLIATLDNLYWLTQNTSEWGDYFQQTADIDASSTSTWHSGSGFSPIGHTSTLFTGTYDGNGYTISGMVISRGSTDNVGLFGRVFGGNISNLTLTDADITGSGFVGLLAGQIDFSSALSNIRVEGSVTGNSSSVGGIAGYGEASTITRSIVNADVIGNSSTGGMVGETGSGLIIQESIVTGNVSGTGAIGGMVGYLLGGSITNSYSTADVTGTSNNLGGLIGVNESGNITRSYATGSVSGGSVMGGLIGLNDSGNITTSYWNTETSGLAIAFGSDNNSESATGLTSAEMLDQDHFSSFDFSDIWHQFSGVSEPFLQALAPDSVNGIPFANYIPSGSGTEGDPYLIATLEHLQWLSAVDSVWDAHFDQTADIDASATAGWGSGKGFLPIGYGSHFLGTYDGNNHIISDLMINRPDMSEIALFGLLQSATILNLGLTDVSITGLYAVGGLAGQFLGSTLSNCYTTGTIESLEGDVGGLIAISTSSDISDSYSSATVSITDFGDYAGGLIASFKNGSITNSYATGTVSGASFSWEIGGLVGTMNATASISSSYATGNVSGSSFVGGLVGLSSGTITSSYAWGDVSDQGDSWDESIGGLVGELSSGSIINSYSSGLVTALNDGGGLVGENSNGTVTGSYWNTSSSGLSNAFGSDDNSQSATGLNKAEMHLKDSFTAFNFVTTWAILTGLSEPYLQVFNPDSVNGIAVDEYEIPTGNGSEAEPFEIATLGHLRWLSAASSQWNASAYFEQTADIDASPTSTWNDGAGFSPIGSVGNNFKGSYAGNGFTISGLVINRPTEDNSGFFGVTENDTEVTNIGLTDVQITGGDRVGGIGGFFSGTITGSYVTGSVSGTHKVGGIVADLTGTGTFSDNYSTATITATGFYGGGLIGVSARLILDSYATGNVSGGEGLGGLIGNMEGSDSNGLARSFATGDVTGTGDHVGGLIGELYYMNITDSYATGDVIGNEDVGGFIGLFDATGSANTIINSYATGHVTGNSTVGGFIGLNYSGVFTDTYWNTETSGQLAAIGSDDNSQTVTGLTSAQMQQQSSFSGFDFDDIWSVFEGFSEPYLQSNPPGSILGLDPSLSYAPTGSGTEGDPYLISSLNNLLWLSQSDSVWDKHFQQTADIDASVTATWSSGSGFTPIGTSTTVFSGEFDGSSFTISELTINRDTLTGVGFFGYAENSVFSNIGLTNVTITGLDMVGGLAGRMSSGAVSNSHTTGTVSGTGSDGDIGGLIGSMSNSTVSNSHSHATVTSTGTDSPTSTGGLIGIMGGSDIIRSYATGNVTAQELSFHTGGLVGTGDAGSSISMSYATGDVIGSSTVGGLMGGVSGTISNSFATGNVSAQEGTGSSIGGLAGMLAIGTSVTNSYSTGRVSGGLPAGGLVGSNGTGSTITGSYWNTGTSEQSVGIGDDDNAQTVTGLGIGEMINEATFSGWDFSSETVWVIEEGFTFPYLKDMGDTRMVVATMDGNEGWRMIGNAGDITYNQFLSPIWTQGFEGSDAGTGSSSNVYFYEESTQSWTAPSSGDDYFGTNSSEENAALNGILLYVYADDDNDGSDDAWPKYLVAENSNLNESFDVSLSYTDNVSDDSTGWNLVSNPYPVSLDWTEVVTNEDISNTFPVAYIWDDSLNSGEGAYRINYGYPLPPGLPQDLIFDGPIPAMQAFWVKATDNNASLTFKPGYQGINKVLYKSAGDEDQPELYWLNLSIKQGDYSDQLTFFTGTEEGKEINVPKLSTIASRYIEFAISDKETVWITRSLPEVEHGTEYSFPLELSTTETGPFTIDWTGLENFGNDWAFTLADNITGANVFLEAGEAYTFKVSGQQNPSELKTRFTLSVISGTSVSNEPKDNLPETFALSQNYPNPFNPSTVIRYQLPVSSEVQLVVFDVLGREVATLVDGERKAAGTYNVTFDARSLASGVYIYRLVTGNKVFTKKLTLIK